MEKPPFLNDVKVKIKDVLYHKDYYMNEDIIDYDVIDYIEFKDFKKNDK